MVDLDNAEDRWGDTIVVAPGAWVRVIWTGVETEVNKRGEPYDKVMIEVAPGEPQLEKFPSWLYADGVIRETLKFFKARVGDTLTLLLTHFDGPYSRWAIVGVSRSGSVYPHLVAAAEDVFEAGEEDDGEIPIPDDEETASE